MSEVREAIEARLDQELLASAAGWRHIKDAERVLKSLQDAVVPHDVEAQRLRMALFALDGESMKNMGDANVANNRRQSELRSESTA
jgi:hypothetical protein